MATRQSQLKAGGHIKANEEEITDMEVKTMQVNLTTLLKTYIIAIFHVLLLEKKHTHFEIGLIE